VLTTEDSGGPLEFVVDGRTGLVVPPTPEAIGAALRLCWDREEELREMGERGRLRVAELSWDEAVGALLGAAGIRL
jgi:glycosyltransferase involved in cell wall biosynthesis